MAPTTLNQRWCDAAGLIFAGGRSSRMGTDKALLEVHGELLIDRVRRALDFLDPVVVVGGQAEDFDEITERWCPDEHPGQGPLGALISGMHVIDADLVVGAACDLPHLSQEHVRTLLDQLAITTAGVAVPLVDGTHQWHIAAWRRRSLPRLEHAFARGERSLRRVGAGLGAVSVVFADTTGFIDLDTPDDLAQAFPE